MAREDITGYIHGLMDEKPEQILRAEHPRPLATREAAVIRANERFAEGVEFWSAHVVDGVARNIEIHTVGAIE